MTEQYCADDLGLIYLISHTEVKNHTDISTFQVISNEPFTIPRKTCEWINIVALVLPIEELYHISNLTIEIHGITVWLIDFYHILDTCDVSYPDKESVYIRFGEEYFTKSLLGIPIGALYETNKMIMTLSGSNDFNFQLITKNTISQTPEDFVGKVIDIPIIERLRAQMKNNRDIIIYDYHMHYGGIASGFFIKVNTIPNGYSIKFKSRQAFMQNLEASKKVNKYEIMSKMEIIKSWNIKPIIYYNIGSILSYNALKFILKYIGSDIAMLLWIPLLSNSKYNDYDNHQTIKRCDISITFNENIYSPIYYISHNILQFSYSMSRLLNNI
jgi:hypothetical protein